MLTLVIEAQVPAHLAGDELAATRGWATALTGVLMGVLAALILVRDPAPGTGVGAGLEFQASSGASTVSAAQSSVRLVLDTDRPLPAMKSRQPGSCCASAALLPTTIAP